MKHIVENFESIEHLLWSNKTRRPNKVFANKNLASEKTDEDRFEFTQTHSYEEAEDLIKNGYSEPLSEIKRGVETNATVFSKQKTAIKNDIVGFAPCVPNAIIGLPKSMVNVESVIKKSKTISLVYDTTAGCLTEADKFIKAGVAVLSLSDALEKSGYRVSLKCAVYNAEKEEERVFATVNLKDWRQPLDLKKMAFPFCHPSMLRRIGFKWLETQPKLTDTRFLGGYGESVANKYDYKKVLEILKKNKEIKENEIYINIRICKDNNFDVKNIATVCGLIV